MSKKVEKRALEYAIAGLNRGIDEIDTEISLGFLDGKNLSKADAVEAASLKKAKKYIRTMIRNLKAKRSRL